MLYFNTPNFVMIEDENFPVIPFGHRRKMRYVCNFVSTTNHFSAIEIKSKTVLQVLSTLFIIKPRIIHRSFVIYDLTIQEI